MISISSRVKVDNSLSNYNAPKHLFCYYYCTKYSVDCKEKNMETSDRPSMSSHFLYFIYFYGDKKPQREAQNLK